MTLLNETRQTIMRWDDWKEFKVDEEWSIIYLIVKNDDPIFLIICKHRNVNCRRCGKNVPEHVWQKKKTLQVMQSI